jgi:crossover junction endodeoxyribonuclease RuvC
VAVIRILGIDPGTQVVGYGCLQLTADGGVPLGGVPLGVPPLAMRTANAVRAASGGGVALLDCGVLRLGRDRLADRLFALAERLRELFARLQPAELALEEAFYGKSVSAALRIGEARGVVLAEAARAGVAIHQYAPARIKRCVTGSGAAGKTTVAAMVLRQLDGADGFGGAPADATDALAVAFTRVEERRSPLLQRDQLEAALGDGDRLRRGRRRR